jgi:hypothetical protein
VNRRERSIDSLQTLELATGKLDATLEELPPGRHLVVADGFVHRAFHVKGRPVDGLEQLNLVGG